MRKTMLARLSEKFSERPEALAKLVELGLVKPGELDAVEEIDLTETIRSFKERISEMARAEPSVLAQLNLRPLELLRSSGDQLPEPGEGARAPLTVVFSDLEGFTGFTARRGDTEAGALLADHYEAVDSIVRSRGGRVVKTIGDGHMLSFAEPAAAVMTSLELVAAAPDPLRIRVGAHNGSVMMMEGDLLGHVVNVASRVADLAAGGMSLVTTSVRDAAGNLPHVAYAQQRTETLAGLDESIDICEVSAD